MKIGVISKVRKEDLAKGGEKLPAWLNSFLSPVNQFIDQVGLALKGRLTIEENIAAKYIDQKMTSGILLTLSTNDRRVVKGVWPVYAEGKQITGWQFDYRDTGRIDFTITFNGGGTTDVRLLVLFA